MAIIVLYRIEGIHYTKHLQVLWALIFQVQFLSHSADLRAFAMCGDKKHTSPLGLSAERMHFEYSGFCTAKKIL